MIIMYFLDPMGRRIKKQMQGMDPFSILCGIICSVLLFFFALLFALFEKKESMIPIHSHLLLCLKLFLPLFYDDDEGS